VKFENKLTFLLSILFFYLVGATYWSRLLLYMVSIRSQPRGRSYKRTQTHFSSIDVYGRFATRLNRL